MGFGGGHLKGNVATVVGSWTDSSGFLHRPQAQRGGWGPWGSLKARQVINDTLQFLESSNLRSSLVVQG